MTTAFSGRTPRKTGKLSLERHRFSIGSASSIVARMTAGIHMSSSRTHANSQIILFLSALEIVMHPAFDVVEALPHGLHIFVLRGWELPELFELIELFVPMADGGKNCHVQE